MLPQNIQAVVSYISPIVVNASGVNNYSNVIISPIPVLQTGLPNLPELIDKELDAKAVITGNFSISGSGNINVSTNGSNIIISEATDVVDTMAFQTTLNSGVSSQFIYYSQPLTHNPQAITCEFQNYSDIFSYSHSISSVNTSGFLVNFSDTLSNTGYVLNSVIKI